MARTSFGVGVGTLSKGGRRSFKAQLLDFVGRVDDFGNDELNDLTSEVFDALVDRTPRKSGEAQAGWAISLGTPGSHVPPHKAGSYSKPRASDFATILAGAGWGDTRVIYNRTPHIRRLEHGSSRQAPRGMVVVAKRRARTRGGRRM